MDVENTVLRIKSFAKGRNRPKSFNKLQNVNRERFSRQDSIGALEDLIQCGICLEKLKDSRMLPCQHTFCLKCLQSQLMVKNAGSGLTRSRNSPSSIRCPVCQHGINLENGHKSIDGLPKNLYLDSLLKVVEDDVSPGHSQKAPDYRCVKCQTISAEQEQVCQHCLQIFCNVCWSEHLNELVSSRSGLLKQVEESQIRLDHKLENFGIRCDQLVNKVKEATERKINEIHKRQAEVLQEIASLKNESLITYEFISDNINVTKTHLQSALTSSSNSNKVTTFLNQHKATSKVLREVNSYCEARVIFDSDNFKLDQDDEGIYNQLDDQELPMNPLENIDTNTHCYKMKTFTPKLIWNRCPRPAHVAIPPWNGDSLYICATDTRTVLILNRTNFKLEGRLTSDQMLCPIGITFSNNLKQIYISDKWQHCVHIFSQYGEYVNRLFSKGNGDKHIRNPDGLAYNQENDQLVLSDSGNNRILLVDPKSGEFLKVIGLKQLNIPQGVAVFDDKIIVADSGNHRIITYSFNGDIVQEFGYLGRRKGQFRSAEVVAVDPLGFILVGDSGNARIQVFKPDGTFIKIFGGEGFGWISGICISNQLDIITTDSKNRTLRIF